MSSLAVTVPSAQVTGGRRALKLAALLAAGAAVFGGTLLVREVTTHTASTTTRAAQPRVAMPKSAALEQKWGIQFNSVTLLAATGVIDVRYTVFDVSKAQALHTNGRTGLPKIITQHGTNFLDGSIKRVIEFYERILRPDMISQLFPGHQFAGAHFRKRHLCGFRCSAAALGGHLRALCHQDLVQRAAASSSWWRASTQLAPPPLSSRFQNGALALR